jgi:hypothetical protein
MMIDADHWKGAQVLDDITSAITLEKELTLIKALSPEFTKDGNQYCFLYGNLPNDCIVGFGTTPYMAMVDFNKNFYNQNA